MRKIFLFLLIFSINAHSRSNINYPTLFKDYDACFILYDLTDQKIVSEYNPHDYCNERLSPDSTFKIPLSLMAFDQGVIKQESIFKWDGTKGVIPEHEHDQTPKTWLQYSVVWVSQRITPLLGEDRIKHYLNLFHYGNQDFSGDPDKHNGLTHAWLSSSLKVSAFEQLAFLKAVLNNELTISAETIAHTKENLYLGKLNNGADYYGKTGSGRHGRNERLSHPSLKRDGWFVGFIQDGKRQYIFVSNLTDKKIQTPSAAGELLPYGSQLLKPITLEILNRYFNRKEIT